MRFVLCPILAGLAMFVWSAISWVVLPLHEDAIHNFPKAAADANVAAGETSIAQLGLTESGVYHYPGFAEPIDGKPVTTEQENAAFERMRQGPLVSLMVYHAEGREPLPPMNFAIGLLVNIIAAAIAMWITWLAAPRLPHFGQRVLVVTSLGAFIFFGYYAQSWVWWGYSVQFGIADTIDLVVGPTLMGLVIAYFVRPPAATHDHRSQP